jgi:hypothetical protein
MNKIRCENCGSKKLQKFGWRPGNLGLEYRQYRCKKCNKFTVDKNDPRPQKKKVSKVKDDKTNTSEVPITETPNTHVVAFKDGCKFSVTDETPMKTEGGGFECAFSHRVKCKGATGNKIECPFWNGFTRIV